MQIKIAERLHPFSHQSGTFCLIPYTTWEVQVFPTRLYFRDLITKKEFEKHLPIKGPIHNFTIELDLEQGCVRVFGKTSEGYMEYAIAKNRLKFKKGHEELLPIEVHALADSKERLSLGMHRSQDWDAVKRRLDLREIFPVWLRLAALVPEGEAEAIPPIGTPALLLRCKAAIERGDKVQIVPLFTQLFQAAFQGIFAPRLLDEHFLGIAPEGRPACSPLILLHEGARLIRSLFIQGEAILPLLPPEFHSGRYLMEEMALEWSKKTIKKIILKSKADRQVQLRLQRQIHSFRLRTSLRGKDKKIIENKPFCLMGGASVYLDRFQK
jgi:hypothetical protein